MRLRMGKFLASGRRAQGKFADQGALLRDLFIELLVLRRIDHVQAAAQDRQGAAAVFQGPLVGRGVDAPGQAAHHRDPPHRQGPGQAAAGLEAVVRGGPGAHQGQGQVVLGQQGPFEEEQGRRIRDLLEAGRKAGISLQENFHPGGGQPGQLRLHPVPVPKAQDIPGQVAVDPLDAEHILATGLKYSGRLPEPGRAGAGTAPAPRRGWTSGPARGVCRSWGQYLTQRRQGAKIRTPRKKWRTAAFGFSANFPYPFS